MREEDGRGQGQTAAPVQDGIAGSTAVCVTRANPTERCGNAGKGAAVENSRLALCVAQARHRVFHRRPPPLEIANGAIPTFPQRRPRSYLFNFNQENQTRPMPFGLRLGNSREEIPVVPRRPPFQDHLVLESNVDFSIILRLENAIVLKPRILEFFERRRSRADMASLAPDGGIQHPKIEACTKTACTSRKNGDHE